MKTIQKHVFGWPSTLVMFAVVIGVFAIPTFLGSISERRGATIDMLQMQINNLEQQIEVSK